MRKIWMAVLAATAMTATAMTAGLFSLAAVAQTGSNLEFENVWVRAMPPFQPNSAGYFALTNHGDVAIAIVGASSNVADKVELHTTRKVEGGLMRMEEIKNGLAIAPGERVEFAPGGKHLMLFGLAFRLVPGDDVEICLQLLTGGEACTEAEVRMSGDESDSPNQHQHHHSTE